MGSEKKQAEMNQWRESIKMYEMWKMFSHMSFF